MARTVFRNAAVYTPCRRYDPGVVVVKGRKVSYVGPEAGATLREDDCLINCRGKIVAPGFVDIHVHGGNGHEFIAPDEKAIIEATECHVRNGTTSLTPASVSIPIDDLIRAIKTVRRAAKHCRADILGFHVEGPYLDVEYRGGHLLEHVTVPKRRDYAKFLDAGEGFITELTLAPELPGALELIHECRKRGVVTSIGHSQATYDRLMAAVEAGLSHSTHFACVMGTLRFEPLQNHPGKGFAPGVLETVLLCDAVTTEVIADGHHLHPGLIKLPLKAKGLENVCLVSDAMEGAGMPDGEYEVGGQTTIVADGIARIKDRPHVIASSISTLRVMVKNMVQRIGVSISEALTMATLNPARIIGVDDRKGSLGPGKDADLVVTDTDFNVQRVFVRGREVQV